MSATGETRPNEEPRDHTPAPSEAVPAAEPPPAEPPPAEPPPAEPPLAEPAGAEPPSAQAVETAEMAEITDVAETAEVLDDGEPGEPRLSLREQANLLTEQRVRRARRQAAAGAAAAVLMVVLAALIVIRVTGEDTSDAAPAPAPATADAQAQPESPAGSPAGSPAAPAGSADPAAVAAIVKAATTVPASVLDKVGTGQVSAGPKPVSGQPALTDGGKPLILYVGAEYCPFCASQRWAVVVALSRFGTFSNLDVSHSASDDVHPDTQTLTFHGAKYTSEYIAFQGVEISSNVREGNGYAPLDTPTAQQQQIFQTLNAPPYVEEGSAGAIPFMDFGNKYVLVGGTYNVELLQGKSAEQITTALRDPADPIAQGVHGSANLFTAMICDLTGNKPARVCTGKAAKAYTQTR